MCHAYGLAIFTLKSMLRQKEELWKLNQIFHHSKKYSLPKIPPKETKILQDITTLYLTNLQVSTQAKIIIFQKFSYKN
jgi:hypothetical protein